MTAAVVVLLMLCAVGWVAVRYSLDFFPPLLAFSFCAWAMLAERMEQRRRAIVAIAITVAAIYSVLANSALVLNRFVVAARPDAIPARSAAAFRRISDEINRIVHGPQAGPAVYSRARLEYRGLVRFAQGTRTGTEALLAVGTASAWNTITVSYDGDRIRAGLEQSGQQPVRSSPFPIDPGHAYALEADYDPATGRLSVALDGTAVLDLSVSLHPIDPDEIAIGSSPRRSQQPAASFSGEIETQRCEIAPDGFAPVAFTSEFPWSRGVWVRSATPATFERMVMLPDRADLRASLRVGTVLRFHVSGARRIVAVEPKNNAIEALLDDRINPIADGWPRAAAIERF